MARPTITRRVWTWSGKMSLPPLPWMRGDFFPSFFVFKEPLDYLLTLGLEWASVSSSIKWG